MSKTSTLWNDTCMWYKSYIYALRIMNRSESDLHSCEATLAVTKKASTLWWSIVCSLQTEPQSLWHWLWLRVAWSTKMQWSSSGGWYHSNFISFPQKEVSHNLFWKKVKKNPEIPHLFSQTMKSWFLHSIEHCFMSSHSGLFTLNQHSINLCKYLNPTLISFYCSESGLMWTKSQYPAYHTLNSALTKRTQEELNVV